MIKPTTLYNFGKVCKSNERAGRVLRALCHQEVQLDETDQEWVEAIKNDCGWMDERIEERREKDRKRQKEWRESHVKSQEVTVTSGDNAPSRAIHPSIHSSIHPSIQEDNTNRSVTVHAHTREEEPERNGNGTVLSDKGNEDMPAGVEEAIRLAHEFASAAREDQGAFFDPQFDVVSICAALTADFKSLKRWRQLANAKGEDAVRQEVFTFWREIHAGEDVRNRGATLNKRLSRLPDAQ